MRARELEQPQVGSGLERAVLQLRRRSVPAGIRQQVLRYRGAETDGCCQVLTIRQRHISNEQEHKKDE